MLNRNGTMHAVFKNHRRKVGKRLEITRKKKKRDRTSKKKLISFKQAQRV